MEANKRPWTGTTSEVGEAFISAAPGFPVGVVADAEGEQIAYVTGDSPEQVAERTNLFAAARPLLEACEMLAHSIGGLESATDGDEWEYFDKGYTEALSRIRAAIAAARGEVAA